MTEFGRKSQIAGAEDWSTFSVLEEPSTMPKVPKGHTIICGLEQEGAEGERMFMLKTLEDVQRLYNQDATGNTTRIHWYHTNAFTEEAVA